ncbi:MAG TPA: VCBS repeat-containing protein [Methanomassiliicoccales archaeon]
MVYVEITTKIGGAWVPGSGLVEIRDFFWDSQLSNTPPSDSPYPPTTYYSQHVTHWTGSVSNVWQSAVNKYRFEINLYNVTGLTPWLPGFNAYILKYDMFQAGTETYVLSNVINVTSPTTKLDIVAGGEPQGGARFQSQASLLYYKNDNSWYPPLMLETTTDKKSYNPVISIIRAGDINGDGKTDFVAVEDDGGTNLYLFIQRSSGGFDKYWISSISGTASDVQLGNTGLGKTLDIVVGYASGAVTLYKNDGIWSKYTVVGSGSPVSSIQVANMVPPGSSGVDINRSMDIVVGRTDGTITVFKNQNGIGTLWNPIKLSSSTTTTQDFAIGEDSTNDIITGSYLDTTSAIQVPWIYEEVQEQLTMRHQISVPAAPKGVLDNCPDDISQLQYANSASNPYTVAGGSNASIVNWDGTGLINDLPTSQVTFEVMYKTNGNNDGTDYITWSNETGKIETSSNMINIQNTEGGWVRASYDLTSKFPLASSLKTLNITYENSNPLSTSVDFRYWSLNVTWVTGDIMDHNWTVKVPSSGSTYAFSAFALRSASNDGDKIEFNYSIDNGLTFKSFSTHLYVGVGSSFTQYSGIITGVTSTGIIKIKASAPWIKTATPGESYLKIGQMTVTTVGATVTSVGTSIAALTVADMNGDGANDIVAIGGSGTLVAFMNCAGSSIFDHPSSPYSTGISNALDIGAGNFFNPYKGKYLDIAVSTATGVYLINQNKTTPGTYDAKFALLTGQSIVKMIAADVDGNGRTDILLATSSAICYYANYQGLKTQGWQYYVVDNQIIGSGGINDLDARKFQTY